MLTEQPLDHRRLWAAQRDVAHLRLLGQTQPLVIQSRFMCLHGAGPTITEIDGCIGWLVDLRAQGGQSARVQIYGVARPPAERHVVMSPPTEPKALRVRVAAALPDVLVER
nr:hypothetical protein [Ktedonobacterales bacterium]